MPHPPPLTFLFENPLVEAGRAYEYRHEGYWRDVGTIEDYWASNMDLISPDPELVLDDSAWPILTLGVDRPPARISGTAGIVDALISPGCVIEGRVERSILAPGVVVEEGATVRDSIVLHETVISSGATVECSIVDAEVSVGEGARIGEGYAPETTGSKPSDSEIALVAKGARIEEDARVAAGDRVEPGATVEAS